MQAKEDTITASKNYCGNTAAAADDADTVATQPHTERKSIKKTVPNRIQHTVLFFFGSFYLYVMLSPSFSFSLIRFVSLSSFSVSITMLSVIIIIIIIIFLLLLLLLFR